MLAKVSKLTFDLRYISDLAINTPGCLRADLGQIKIEVPDEITQIARDISALKPYDYAPTFGDPALIEVLQQFEFETFRNFKKGKFLVTAGGQAGLYATIHSLVGPGDSVLADHYYYPPYKGITSLSEANFIQHHFNDLENLSNPEAVKLILLNSPNNPSGEIYEADQLKLIADMARKHDWIILEDRVYDKIFYDQPPVSISSYCPERTLILNSASKNFTMPGIRIGWLYGPEELITNITKVHRNMNSCPNTFFQKVLAEFIPHSDGYFALLRMEMKSRRDQIIAVFEELGWSYELPQGAIYTMVSVPELNNSMEFAESMIREAGISSMPGTFFGQHPNQLRFCFGAMDHAGIKTMHKRLINWLKGR